MNETTGKLSAIYRRILSRLVSARIARNKLDEFDPERFMLCGKVKAYTEMLCLMRDKYPQNIDPELLRHVPEPVAWVLTTEYHYSPKPWWRFGL